MRPIDADAIPYTMLYKENWLKGTGVEKPGVWKDTIDAMPTISFARPTGKWINCRHGDATCSLCRITQYNVWDFDNWQRFCGHCGAEMEGVE